MSKSFNSLYKTRSRSSSSEESFKGFEGMYSPTKSIGKAESVVTLPKIVRRRTSSISSTLSEESLGGFQCRGDYQKSPSAYSVFSGFESIYSFEELADHLKGKSHFKEWEIKEIERVLDEIRDLKKEGWCLSDDDVLSVLGDWFSTLLKKRMPKSLYSVADVIDMYDQVLVHLKNMQEVEGKTRSVSKKKKSYEFSRVSNVSKPDYRLSFDKVVFKIAEDSTGISESFYDYLKLSPSSYTDRECERIKCGIFLQRDIYTNWIDALKSKIATLFIVSNIVTSGKMELKRVKLGVAVSAIGSLLQEFPIVKTAVKTTGALVEEKVNRVREKPYKRISFLIQGKEPWECASEITEDINDVLTELGCQKNNYIKDKIYEWVLKHLKKTSATHFKQLRVYLKKELKSRCVYKM
ncbi:hypothetical protein DID78_05280 [Candidatus Marinamargulisbacteria bacterium SCGC AG-343-D04]|nr:hypothetical protein DID78_05280 [Candidatus Marinamargulisbacteria bacterium SCGC AG-343-D04]